MLKRLLGILIIVGVMITMSQGACKAAEFDNNKFNKAKICALLVAPIDMKSEHFVDAVQDEIKTNNDINNIDSGMGIQSKYQEFWLSKGEIEEGKLTKKLMHEFVKYSGYEKCLFIIPSNSVEKTNVSNRTRASVETKAFLVDDTNVLKIISVTKSDDSKTSDFRAKRSAFEKCMKEIAEQFYAFLSQRKLN